MKRSLTPALVAAMWLAAPCLRSGDAPPVNPDGYFSLSMDNAMSTTHEIERSSTPYFDSGSGTVMEKRRTLVLSNSWYNNFSFEAPVNSALSLGLNFRHQGVSFDGHGGMYGLGIGPHLRFHFSGKDWNRPWGEGGSPWGRLFRPTLELGMLVIQDQDSDATIPLSQGPEYHVSVGLPLLSWLYLETEDTLVPISESSSRPESIVPAVLQHVTDGNEFSVGLKLALPFPYFFHDADYTRNVNPDGRLGLPVFTWKYTYFASLEEGPFSETQVYGMLLPIRPSLSLAFHWDVLIPDSRQNARRAIGTDSYGSSAQSALGVALKYYLGSLGQQSRAATESENLRKELKNQKNQARLDELAKTGAVPMNPDAAKSLGLVLGYAPGQTLGRGDSPYFWYEHFERSVLWSRGIEADILVPKNPVFSLGFKGSYWSSRIINASVQNDGTRLEGEDSFDSIDASLPMRFHSSGRHWNQPWGTGGSPWGRILRPAFDLRPGFLWSSGGRPIFSLRGNTTFPIASWIAISLGTTKVAGDIYNSWSDTGRAALPGNRERFPGTLDAGLKVGFPAPSWFGEADYTVNANPDGRLGLPVAEAFLGGFSLFPDYPAPIQLAIGVVYPWKPWFSLGLTWTKTDFSDPSDASTSSMQTWMLSPRFYWGAAVQAKGLSSKSVEDAGQMPQNQVLENPTPVSPAIEEPK